MSNINLVTKALPWNAYLDWAKSIQFIIAALFAMVVIFLGMPQLVTGVIINMVLILTADRLGTNKAIFLGMITPITAAFSGVLPIALIAMIPFIAIANAIYVSLYNIFSKKEKFFAVGVGAVAKFCFLYAASSLIVLRPITVMMGEKVYSISISSIVAFMMGWPQAVTALVGGSIAVVILNLFVRLRAISSVGRAADS